MRRLVLLSALLACSPALAQTPLDTLRTTAERSDFRATSTHADVVRFVEAVAAAPGLHATTFGTSFEGRSLPLAVWNAAAATPEAVRDAGKLRVLIVANIHAGEVAGKEAALSLLRRLALGEHDRWADSLTLLVAPIYNADGNERMDPDNRPLQHGPVDGMGQRPNAQGLDLNRDFVKLDAPESRALVGAIDAYDPHVVLDLHTTNGTIHGYHLTYAPPLHPNTSPALDSLLRTRWLPDVTRAVNDAYGWDMTYYGNDKPEWGQPPGWATFDPRPRFGTNYVGLRNRVAILSEAYSYATFRDRVLATDRFVTAVLDWAAAHAGEVREAIRQAEAPVVGERLALRSAGTWEASGTEEILLGEAVEEPNPHTGSPMLRRTDAQTPTEMTVYGRFSGREGETVPAAYLVPADLADVLDRLDAHGIEHFAFETDAPVAVEAFRVDSVRLAERPFQKRHEREAFGRYTADAVAPGAGLRVVPVDGPLGRLAFSLLEPRSDSGLMNWGFIETASGSTYPILRIPDPDVARSLRPSR